MEFLFGFALGFALALVLVVSYAVWRAEGKG